MVQSPRLNRRSFTKLVLATAGTVMAPALLARGAARIIVVGGGVAGLTTARRLAGKGDGAEVVLIEPNKFYTTPFFSNRVLAGLNALEDFTFGYDVPAAQKNLRIIHDRAINGDPGNQTLTLAGGATLAYDRLIVAPGTALNTSDISGYNAATAQIFPHAYSGSSGDQWGLLRDQIFAMDDGGVVIISAPKRPYKCTPAPYERAALIAWYLTRHKPKSKVLILDSKSEFPLMDAMIEVWDSKFSDMIEWVSADFGGAVAGVNNKERAVFADGEKFSPDVGNIIPPQRAAVIAHELGLVDDSGWCPVNPLTFESTRQAGIHVLGDAIDGGDMPKSASAAHRQALSAAIAINNLLNGRSNPTAELENACYFLTEPEQALVVGGRYNIADGRINGVEGYSSDPGEDRDVRRGTAQKAEQWYKTVTSEMFD